MHRRTINNNQKRPELTIVFAILGGLMVLFVLLPLVSIIFSASAFRFFQTLVDPEMLRSLQLTFGAAACATLIACVGGLPLAYQLARHKFPGKRWIEGIMDLPVVVPHTAAGIALLMVFGSRGVLGQFFEPLGIFFTNNANGIVVAMLFVSLPYLVNMSREAFALIDPELERVALTDGASAWQAFLYVTLPLAWRGILGGALMMWARGISEFGAVVILAYHPKIVPVLIYERFEGFGLNAAQPVAVVLILAVLVVFTLLRVVLMPEEKT